MTKRVYTGLAIVGAMAGALLIASSIGANERRCGELGSACICSEPLNTGTVDGGRPWPTQCPAASEGACRVDPDDSPSATECPGESYGSGGQAVIALGTPPITVTSAATQPLPSGNALTWVLTRASGDTAKITAPDVNEPPNTTYCSRSYQRWDAASPIPGSGTAVANSQYKLATIGGVDPNGNHNPVQTGAIQGGSIFTRFDGSWFNAPEDFQTMGNMSECVSNFCRFEMCIDFGADGIGRARFRKAVLPPGTAKTYTVTKPAGTTARSVMKFSGGYNDPLQWYSQEIGGLTIRYATHVMVAKHAPVDGSWWIGAACEVEGGCSGSPQPPPPARPDPPVLLP